MAERKKILCCGLRSSTPFTTTCSRTYYLKKQSRWSEFFPPQARPSRTMISTRSGIDCGGRNDHRKIFFLVSSLSQEYGTLLVLWIFGQDSYLVLPVHSVPERLLHHHFRGSTEGVTMFTFALVFWLCWQVGDNQYCIEQGAIFADPSEILYEI